MHPVLKAIPSISWLILISYWAWSSRKVKLAARQENPVKQFLCYWLPLLIAGLLLGPGHWFGHSLLREQFVPHTNLVGLIGGACCIAGFCIACYARYLLGKNWSLAVQLKEKHELVVTGPYRYVRHPIYSGLLLLFAGNAIVVGDWRGIVAVILVFISFWMKLKTEERWLISYFGTAYTAYIANTKAIIPWLI